MILDKQYYTRSEVCRIVNITLGLSGNEAVKLCTIKFWTDNIKSLHHAPKKNKNGNVLYRNDQARHVLHIASLIKVQGVKLSFIDYHIDRHQKLRHMSANLYEKLTSSDLDKKLDKKTIKAYEDFAWLACGLRTNKEEDG